MKKIYDKKIEDLTNEFKELNDWIIKDREEIKTYNQAIQERVTRQVQIEWAVGVLNKLNKELEKPKKK